MNKNDNSEQIKKANKQLSDNKDSKSYSNAGLNSSTSDAIPKDTSRLNIQSTGNDFYTGISNDDMSSMSNINNTNGDAMPQVSAVNKDTTKK
ncbi:hypothetical protein [Clostridium tagluense]|uniref:hypothetical protein n=1 Tax=Clostridium tagluense TaxID=360422 RepID=UPI001CF4DBD5|nr:hypothetical protein [Clostridium tagluense]MCB2296516.1 hypothetical protein [Clostridium tagluense]